MTFQTKHKARKRIKLKENILLYSLTVSMLISFGSWIALFTNTYISNANINWSVSIVLIPLIVNHIIIKIGFNKQRRETQ